jgi:hypothetical protein
MFYKISQPLQDQEPTLGVDIEGDDEDDMDWTPGMERRGLRAFLVVTYISFLCIVCSLETIRPDYSLTPEPLKCSSMSRMNPRRHEHASSSLIGGN